MPELASSPGVLLVVALLSYLAGSIPFGVVITRAMGLGDLRAIGSGNIGATNVLRTGNKGAALLTVLLDAAKGGLAALAARALAGEDAAQVAGLSAFLGHLWPVWLGFRGGKGISTFLGVLLALAWPAGLLACAAWAATAALTRYSSLSGLVAAALSPVFAWATGRGDLVLLAIGLAILIFVRHHANIRRLLDGTEPRIGKKSEG
jgi:glycerol-3-phosphate acyltransferase PlsY